MKTGEPADRNPWVPEVNAGPAAVPAAGPSWLRARIHQYPQVSWLSPLFSLAFWIICRRCFDEITFIGWEIWQWPLPDFDRFMAVVTTVSVISCGVGACSQIVLLADRKNLPGVYRHLLPAMLLSAYCAAAALSQLERTSTVIENYSNESDGQKWEMRGGHRPPVARTPLIDVSP
ncbi:MAG: hypothetical protein ACKO3T_01635 [Planctomycetaceae bacterium]